MPNHIILNGTKTHETCPCCQEENVLVEHGYEERGKAFPLHLQHCPVCGDQIVIVGYDCPHCKKPKEWADHGFVGDRFVLDGPAFAKWCAENFNIRDRASAMNRITEIDPLSERVVIDGIAYLIPDECYQKITPEDM
ncbi:hypothetical protein ANRL3_02837 [Anaerolineae bacterium]|nr:hypothetical protein ANRL3_02837 [Anaerolineae bacterium]